VESLNIYRTPCPVDLHESPEEIAKSPQQTILVSEAIDYVSFTAYKQEESELAHGEGAEAGSDGLSWETYSSVS
jgi:hypothetical protein